MTRTERMSDLLAITARLISCMELEIKLLRAMRPHEIQSIQLDKAALADAYEAHLLALRQEPSDSDAVGAALRAELLQATERFQSVLAENARALKAVKVATERVMKAIVEAAERQRAHPAAYTPTGASGLAGATRAAGRSAPLCVAVNQRL